MSGGLKKYVYGLAVAKQKPDIHYENMPIQMYWKFYHQKM